MPSDGWWRAPAEFGAQAHVRHTRPVLAHSEPTKQGGLPVWFGWGVAAVLAMAATAFFVRQAWTWDAAALDSSIYRAAVRDWLAGGDVYADKFGSDGGGLPFTYPPFALLFLLPLAGLPATAANVVMFAVSAICLCLVVRWCQQYARTSDAPQPLWTTVGLAAVIACLVEPVRTTLGLGQVNLMLLALILGVDTLRHRWRGVGAGIATAVKVTSATIVVGYGLRGDGAGFRRGLVTAAVCTASAAVINPRGTWQYFTTLVWDAGRTGNVEYIGNQSLKAAVLRSGIGNPQVVWALMVLIVAVVAVLAIRRHRGDVWMVTCIAAIAGLLVSPISWTHHWVWVLPVAAVGLRVGRTQPLLAAASALVVLPTLLQSLLWTMGPPPWWSVNMYCLAAATWLVAALVSVGTEPGSDPAFDAVANRRAGSQAM